MLIVLKIIFLSLLTNGVTQVSEDEGEEGNKGGGGAEIKVRGKQ